MSTARLTSFLAAALFAIGCGGGGATSAGGTTPGKAPATQTTAVPDRPPTVPLSGAAERLLVLFEDLAQQVRGANGDCNAYASAMSGWTVKNSGTYIKLRAEVSGIKLPASEETRFDNRLAAAMTNIVETASSCGNNEPAWAAFRKWDELMESE